MSTNVVLVFTNSSDITTDVLFQFLPSQTNSIFRFNFDLFENYDLMISDNKFFLSDPIGRIVTSENIKKAYYRKPARKSKFDNPFQEYSEQENWHLYRELLFFLWEKDKLVLVEPDYSGRTNKTRQFQIAKDFFLIPPTLATNKIENHMPTWEKSVVKSLSGKFIGKKHVFTSLVNASDLDSQYSWYVQEYIEATYDLTVAFVRGKTFSFRLKRDFLLESIDFRAPTTKNLWDMWEPYNISPNLQKSILEFMFKMKLDYGRIDFLITEDGQVYFCEVNPNGQFAWLDVENKTGLLSAIVQEISPDTDVHPIPYNPFK